MSDRPADHGRFLSGTQSGSRRVHSDPTPAEWDTFRGVIEDLYLNKALRLKDVKLEMERVYGFRATPRMFKSRLTSWSLGKNITKNDWLAIALLLKQRQDVGKSNTVIEVHNRMKTVGDFRKHVKSCNKSEGEFLAEAADLSISVPPYIRCFTPDCHTSEKSSGHSSSLQPIPAGLPGTQDYRMRTPSSSKSSRDAQQLRQAFQFVPISSNTNAMQSSSRVNGAPAMLPPRAPPEISSEDFSDLQSQGAFLAARQEPCDDLQQAIGTMIAQTFDPDRLELLSPGLGDLDAWSLISRDQDQNGPGRVCSKCSNDSRAHSPLPTDFLYEPTAELPQKVSYYLESNISDSSDSDDYSAFTASCMGACMYGAREEYDVLGICLQRAAVVYQRMLNNDSSLALTAVNTALTWLHAHEQGPMAASVIRCAYRVALSVLGEGHPVSQTLEWMTAVAGKKVDECRITTEILRKVYRGFQVSHGPDHQHTIVALYNLGFNLIRDKAFADAETHLKHLCVISAEKLGASHLQTVTALSTLSRAQSRQEKHELAIETLKKSLDKAPLGPNHPHRLESLRRLAIIFQKLGRFQEEEPIRWRIFEGAIATLGKQHTFTKKSRHNLMDLLKDLGKWEMMESEVQRLYDEEAKVQVSDDENWWRRVVAQGTSDGGQMFLRTQGIQY